MTNNRDFREGMLEARMLELTGNSWCRGPEERRRQVLLQEGLRE